MKDATRVRVALTGSIWVADEGATIPGTVEDVPGPEFADLGYTSEDGVTFTIGRETTDIPGWQSLEPLRRLVTATPTAAAFVLRQLERATLLNSLGGTITPTGTGLFRWEPDETNLPVKVLLIDFVDGDFSYRFGFRRAQNLAEVEIQLVNNAAIDLPNEWSALAAGGETKAWFIDTNDPSWDEDESSV
ncbi:MAG: hypothetical protein M0R37_11965 [Bacteroidales bacterium]|jgi:hypothetical protein|nr:hypothetical protein [Bacteroidales bacterium]